MQQTLSISSVRDERLIWLGILLVKCGYSSHHAQGVKTDYKNATCDFLEKGGPTCAGESEKLRKKGERVVK